MSVNQAFSGTSRPQNNAQLMQFENREFSQGKMNPGNKPITFGSVSNLLPGPLKPFHSFNPLAEFSCTTAPEGSGFQANASSENDKHQSSVNQVSAESDNVSMQSRPPAEEVFSQVLDGALSLPPKPVVGKENLNPKVSLPKKPVSDDTISQKYQPYNETTTQQLEPATAEDPRNKPPIRVSKKMKRQAPQWTSRVAEAEEKSEDPHHRPDSSANAAVDATAQRTASEAPEPKKEKAGPPSLFTADEIKDRKKAWNRIAVPLNSPRKPSESVADAVLPSKRSHDRAVSLPPTMPKAARSAQEIKPKDSAQEDKPAAEHKLIGGEPKVGETSSQSVGSERATSVASMHSPKKAGKRKYKRRQQDSVSKVPAKEHKL